jgi:hypothetical protein
MTATEIIQETADYYTKDTNRRAKSADTNECAYNGKDNTHCAVGRYLKVEHRKDQHFGKNQGVQSLAIDKGGGIENIDKILVKRAHGHHWSFWSALQDLHDMDGYWDGSGLTGFGQGRLERLLKEYED